MEKEIGKRWIEKASSLSPPALFFSSVFILIKTTAMNKKNCGRKFAKEGSLPLNIFNFLCFA
jgi:hypothetical protein